MPLATLGRRDFRRSRYTSVHMSVGTWTLDFSTRIEMKVSSEGIGDACASSCCWEKPDLVGVAGGEGRGAAGGGPHWITSTALAAR